MKSEEFEIKSIWTSDISVQQIDEFLAVQRKVFNGEYKKSFFEYKYQKNIFGDSLIVLIYKKEECVAARAFWKNEIDSKAVYQPCDTAVIQDYRGRGLFKLMTMEALSLLPSDMGIFNFPNDNSFSAYKKLGWKLHSIKKFQAFIFFRDKNKIDEIPESYFNWISESGNKVNYVKLKNEFYMIKKRKLNLYYIVGKIKADKINLINSKRIILPVLLFYSEKGKIGRGLYTVTKNIEKETHIPVYKIDTIFNE